MEFQLHDGGHRVWTSNCCRTLQHGSASCYDPAHAHPDTYGNDILGLINYICDFARSIKSDCFIAGELMLDTRSILLDEAHGYGYSGPTRNFALTTEPVQALRLKPAPEARYQKRAGCRITRPGSKPANLTLTACHSGLCLFAAVLVYCLLFLYLSSMNLLLSTTSYQLSC